MINYEQLGETLDLVAPYAVTSGQGFLVGSIFAVAVVNAALGETLAGCTRGVFSLAAKSTDTGAVGTKVYWDNTEREITTTSTDNTLVGALTAAKTAGQLVAYVRLNGTVS
jgi:predicted RecA/RadA family phage recombinase